MTGRFLHQRGGIQYAHLIESSGLGGLKTLHAWSADHVHYFPGPPTCGLIQLRISPTVASQRQYYTILINESAKHVRPKLCAPMRSMCPYVLKQKSQILFYILNAK
jgi:hypothetical protein